MRKKKSLLLALNWSGQFCWSSCRLIFQCPLSLVSDLHICWNTFGCSLCSSDQLGVSLVLRVSGLRSHLSRCHLHHLPIIKFLNGMFLYYHFFLATHTHTQKYYFLYRFRKIQKVFSVETNKKLTFNQKIFSIEFRTQGDLMGATDPRQALVCHQLEGGPSQSPELSGLYLLHSENDQVRTDGHEDFFQFLNLTVISPNLLTYILYILENQLFS